MWWWRCTVALKLLVPMALSSCSGDRVVTSTAAYRPLKCTVKMWSSCSRVSSSTPPCSACWNLHKEIVTSHQSESWCCSISVKLQPTCTHLLWNLQFLSQITRGWLCDKKTIRCTFLQLPQGHYHHLWSPGPQGPSGFGQLASQGPSSVRAACRSRTLHRHAPCLEFCNKVPIALTMQSV